MGYWDSREVKDKLSKAYSEISRQKKFKDLPTSKSQYRKIQRQQKKKAKKLRAILRENPNVVFSNVFHRMYKLCWDFKKNFIKRSKVEILAELRRLSEQKFVNKIDYKRRRSKKHFIKGQQCFACKKKADIQHHIILLINGGYDNGINRIPLCNDCHKELHPWLKEKDGKH